MLAAASLLPASAGARGGRSAAAGLLTGVNVAPLNGKPEGAGLDAAVGAAGRLHARLLRIGVLWAAVQPRPGGAYDLSALAGMDRLVADAQARGMQVIATVDGTPCWDSTAPAAVLRRCVPGRSSAANAWPPRNTSAFAAFAAFIAARYAGSLAAIEIWNEPDQANQAYLAGPNKVQHYAALVRAAYPAIKQAAPGVAVLAGSLVGSNGSFLRQLYAAGMKGYYDGLAVHYYALTLASVRAIHEVQLANGDPKPLWLDEFGWSSCYPRRIEQEQACVTAGVQAADLANTIRALAQAPYVHAAVVYKLQDSPAEAFGMLSTSGRDKPSFRAVAGAMASPGGATTPVHVTLRAHGSHLLAKGSGPVGDFMALEAFAGPTLRYRAYFLLDRFNRFSIPLPSVLGVHGITVRVYQYWSGPAAAASAGV
jgi:hypothetical protein